MKILLIRPAVPSEKMASVLPLGLLAVGTALKQNDHRVRILDLRRSPDPDAHLKRELQTFGPDLVGVGLMTIESDSAFALAGQIKTITPGTPVIFGGPHCAHDPQYILHDDHVDAMVIGEGEATVVDLVSALETGRPLHTVQGIAFRENGEIVATPEREAIVNIDTLETDYGLVDVPSYFDMECSHEYLPASHRFLPLMTSRGCPYTCIYCHELFGKTMRFRSTDKVLEEMEFLMRTYGVREFHILDDVFNINMKRAKQIFSALAQRPWNLKLAFPNGVRADLIDDEMIRYMKDAGVYRLALGIESGSQRIQEMISKSLDIKILKDICFKLTRAGISVNGFFMLGFPGETREEMEETIDFACRLDLSTALFSLAIPNPGTDLRALTIRENQTEAGDFSQYSINAINNNASAVSTEELKFLQRSAYRRFYLTPHRIWKILQTTRSKKLLAQKFWSLLKLIRPWPQLSNFPS